MLPPVIAPASRRRPSSMANRRSASQSCGLTGTGKLRSALATAGADSSAFRMSPWRDRASQTSPARNASRRWNNTAVSQRR